MEKRREMLPYELNIVLNVGNGFLNHVQNEVMENLPNYGFKVEMAKKLGYSLQDPGFA